MGTTLTGTAVKDTYDSLIKVTDNGPLSGSLKTLTDGLGNDSALALSTGAASVTGTLAVTGDSTLSQLDLVAAVPTLDLVLSVNTAFKHTIEGTNYSSSPASSNLLTFKVASAANTQVDVMTLNGAGNVGIGTSSPTGKITVAGEIDTLPDNAGAGYGSRISNPFNGVNAYDLAFSNRTNSGTWTEVGRFLAGGGLTFNGDTAAANALDDYEEGTFTATLAGSTTNPTTPVTTTGRYTKIGNRVNYSVSFSNVNTTGASGIVSVTGFPFTSNANQVSQGGVAAHTLLNLNGAAFTAAFMGGGATQVNLLGTQSNGAWIDTIHNATAAGWLFISGTYEV